MGLKISNSFCVVTCEELTYLAVEMEIKNVSEYKAIAKEKLPRLVPRASGL